MYLLYGLARQTTEKLARDLAKVECTYAYWPGYLPGYLHTCTSISVNHETILPTPLHFHLFTYFICWCATDIHLSPAHSRALSSSPCCIFLASPVLHFCAPSVRLPCPLTYTFNHSYNSLPSFCISDWGPCCICVHAPGFSLGFFRVVQHHLDYLVHHLDHNRMQLP